MTARPKQNGHDLIGNEWLAALSPELLDCLRPNLNTIDLNTRSTLLNIGDPINTLWFPIRGTMGSLFDEAENGDITEVALIGCEGAFGLYDLGNADGALYQAKIWAEGQAYEVSADALYSALGHELNALIISYTRSIASQMAQALICRDNHKNPCKRLARWLLQAQDRTGKNSFVITQEEFALKLGITRQAVCNAGQTLEEKGLIYRGHGKIVINNREGLIAEACPCYFVSQPRNPSNEIMAPPETRGKLTVSANW